MSKLLVCKLLSAQQVGMLCSSHNMSHAQHATCCLLQPAILAGSS